MLVKSPKRFTRATIRTQAPYVWLLKTPTKKKPTCLYIWLFGLCCNVLPLISLGRSLQENLQHGLSQFGITGMMVSCKSFPSSSMGIENILVIHGDVSPTNPWTSSLGCSVENFEKNGKLRTYLLQLSFGLVGGFKDLLCSILAMG